MKPRFVDSIENLHGGLPRDFKSNQNNLISIQMSMNINPHGKNPNVTSSGISKSLSKASNDQLERMYCFVRIRPLLPQEKHEKCAVNTTNREKLLLYYKDSNLHYKFDQVFNDRSSQKDIFAEFKVYIKKLFSGRSCTVMAYGQTGSGKTHTMFGMDSETAKQLERKNREKQSIVPRHSNSLPRNAHQRTEVEINIEQDEFKMGLIPRISHYIFD